MYLCSMIGKKLDKDYYTQTNVVFLAKDLIGKILVTHFNNQLTSGVITETEAYAGITDKGSHAFGGRYTPRTKVMFMEGGVAYIYLCYGMYSLFNVVTNIEGIPHAILIRAIQPLDGMETMKLRTSKKDIKPSSFNGPGKLTKALGLHFSQTGESLIKNKIWIEDRQIHIDQSTIETTPRVGIDYAGEDALLPYRFVLKNPIIL